jgi:hypothetical protein
VLCANKVIGATDRTASNVAAAIIVFILRPPIHTTTSLLIRHRGVVSFSEVAPDDQL